MNLVSYKSERGITHALLLVGILVVVAVGGIGVYVSRKNVSHASTCYQNVYSQSRGSSGNCVKYIQTMLNSLAAHKGWAGNGYAGGAQLAVDGSYGPKTKQQVLVAQTWYNSWHSIPYSVDGVVGKQTWWLLCSYSYHNHLSAASDAAGLAAGCPSF